MHLQQRGEVAQEAWAVRHLCMRCWGTIMRCSAQAAGEGLIEVV
jgi:hypothetical protein